MNGIVSFVYGRVEHRANGCLTSEGLPPESGDWRNRSVASVARRETLVDSVQLKGKV